MLLLLKLPGMYTSPLGNVRAVGYQRSTVKERELLRLRLLLLGSNRSTPLKPPSCTANKSTAE
jgi:hypothetical protein